MASLKPELFCGVASLGEKAIGFSYVYALEQSIQTNCDANNLRHNNCQATVNLTAEQRLHTVRTNWTLHCLLQTVCPKRETIRIATLTVKRAQGEG